MVPKVTGYDRRGELQRRKSLGSTLIINLLFNNSTITTSNYFPISDTAVKNTVKLLTLMEFKFKWILEYHIRDVKSQQTSVMRGEITWRKMCYHSGVGKK